MKQLVQKHPLAIRWFHWINFPLLFLMIWSGVLIYWAYPAYFTLDQKITDESILRQIRDAFYVDTDAWKAMVFGQARAASLQAIAALTP